MKDQSGHIFVARSSQWIFIQYDLVESQRRIYPCVSFSLDPACKLPIRPTQQILSHQYKNDLIDTCITRAVEFSFRIFSFGKLVFWHTAWTSVTYYIVTSLVAVSINTDATWLPVARAHNSNTSLSNCSPLVGSVHYHFSLSRVQICPKLRSEWTFMSHTTSP